MVTERNGFEHRDKSMLIEFFETFGPVGFRGKYQYDLVFNRLRLFKLRAVNEILGKNQSCSFL